MTHLIVSLFVEVHPAKAKLTLFCNGHSFFTASTVSAYSLGQMLLKVIAHGMTRSSHNALYDHCSSRFDIAFDGMYAETYPNMG